MSRPGPQLYVTVDDTTGAALLRGPEARHVSPLFGGRWSKSGRGWVIPAGQVADVRAYCDYYRILAVVHQRKEGNR